MSVTILNVSQRIKIKSEVIEILESYKQISRNDCEAGGMLIGYETIDNDIIIEYATEPLKNDKRSRYRFDRVDKKHNKILEKIWSKEGQIHMYLGEWHTHPENLPNYSSQDSLNWINIGKKMPKKKFIHIIVGIKETRGWEYTTKNEQINRIL